MHIPLTVSAFYTIQVKTVSASCKALLVSDNGSVLPRCVDNTSKKFQVKLRSTAVFRSDSLDWFRSDINIWPNFLWRCLKTVQIFSPDSVANLTTVTARRLWVGVNGPADYTAASIILRFARHSRFSFRTKMNGNHWLPERMKKSLQR